MVIKKLNLKTEIIPDNWKNTLSNLKNHSIDLHPSVYYTKQRTTFGLYNKPHIQIKEYLYIQKNNKIESFEDLKNKKIAILKGYGTIPKIKEKYPTIQIVETNNLEESIKLVLSGKVQALFDIQLVVNNYLKNNMITGLKEVFQTDFTPSPLHFFSNIKKPILNKILQKGLDSITTQEKNTIISKWLYKANNIQKLDFLTFKEKEYLKNKKIITMCNNPNWEPIEFAKDGNLNNMNGIAIDTIKLLEKKLNIKFQNIPTKSWSQSQQFLKEKKCDILPCAIKTSKREKYANFTDPYLKLPLAIFTTNNKPIISSLDDVSNQFWARKKGSGVIAKVKKLYPNIKLIETKDNTEALNLVSSGEVYFTIATLPVASNIIEKYQLNNLKIAGYTGIQFNLSMAIRDDDKILLNILDKSLQKISKEESKNIMKKWVNSSIKESVTDYKLLWEILIIVFIVVLTLIYRENRLKEKNKILQNNIKQFEELMNSAIESMVLFKNKVCIDINNETLKLFGYKSKSEMIGKTAMEFVASESQKLVFEKMKNNAEPFEAIMLKADGTKFPALIRGRFIEFNGEIIRVSSTIDLTELKQKDKMLHEQSKLASMGEMIGNIAHQWRQPLSVISTASTGIKIQKEFNILKDEELYKMCDTINDNAQYLSKTIDDFRDFIKGDSKVMGFDLKNDTDAFLRLVDSNIKKYHINVVLNLHEHIKVNGYPRELLQCFINIFNNAKDALVENNKEDNRYIFISQEIIDNNIIIKFKDNAGGIPNDIINNIFEPYFTTKHKSQGTGLGLHMTYNLIVDGMGGTIEAINQTYTYRDKEYIGAVFKIELPLKSMEKF